MRKLIIQIPCYNEEASLAVTLGELPRQLPGIDKVEWLIINDGSTDRTVEVAKECGVDHIVNLAGNQGLAKAFMAGIEASLRAGADIIVNTDADNQYCASDIPNLISPILLCQADIVVGTRPVDEIKHFSPIKKLLQKLGSWVVRVASNTDIPDAPSGFRAIGREAAMELNVFNRYTYTLEMIIQVGQKGMAIISVPVRTNGYLRPSRLVKSIPGYVQRSILTILRIFMLYKPLRFFTFLGMIPFTAGALLGIRWLLFFFAGYEKPRVPTLILAAILILIGFQLWMFGLVADLIATNRRILEDIQRRTRSSELDGKL
ncbi:MAG: glycosyltransferase family 2 protein [Hormoscilla sp. GUM202]|nr:glycosyltransferase family 2 protein [Hormoscilla sp. GUM202]